MKKLILVVILAFTACAGSNDDEVSRTVPACKVVPVLDTSNWHGYKYQYQMHYVGTRFNERVVLYTNGGGNQIGESVELPGNYLIISKAQKGPD